MYNVLELLCGGYVIDFIFYLFKQKTAYEMRISDWSSDVCSSDLEAPAGREDYADRETWQKPGRSACRPRTAGAGDRQPRRQRARRDARRGDRKSVVSGKRVSVRVDLGGRLFLKPKK